MLGLLARPALDYLRKVWLRAMSVHPVGEIQTNYFLVYTLFISVLKKIKILHKQKKDRLLLHAAFSINIALPTLKEEDDNSSCIL